MSDANKGPRREAGLDGALFEIYDPKRRYYGTWGARSPSEALARLLSSAGLRVGYDPDRDASVCDERTRQVCLPIMQWSVRKLERGPEPGTRPNANELPDDFFGTAIGLRMELERCGKRWPIVLSGWLTRYGKAGEMARWPSGVGAIATAGDEHIEWGTWKGDGNDAVLMLDDGTGRFTDCGLALGQTMATAASSAPEDIASSKGSGQEATEPSFPLQVAAMAVGVAPAKFIYWMGWAGYLHR